MLLHGIERSKVLFGGEGGEEFDIGELYGGRGNDILRLKMICQG